MAKTQLPDCERAINDQSAQLLIPCQGAIDIWTGKTVDHENVGMNGLENWRTILYQLSVGGFEGF